MTSRLVVKVRSRAGYCGRCKGRLTLRLKAVSERGRQSWGVGIATNLKCDDTGKRRVRQSDRQRARGAALVRGPRSVNWLQDFMRGPLLLGRRVRGPVVGLGDFKEILLGLILI